MKTESKISAYTIRSAALTVVFLVAIVGFASAFYLSEREPGVSWRSAKLVKAVREILDSAPKAARFQVPA